MNLREIAREVSKETKIPATTVYPILVATVNTIIKLLLLGHIIKLRGLLTMKMDIKKERRFKNPITLEVSTLPRMFYLSFSVSEDFKAKLRAKKTY